MKLCSDIKPRRDGKLNATANGKLYVFTGTPLTAEVDEQDVAYLLNTGSFYPADAEDFERAGVKLSGVLSAAGSDDAGGDDLDEDDEDGDEIIGDGAPVEALTPVKPHKRAKKAK